MSVEFHPQAALEFEDAVLYYNERQPGLGKQLMQEVYTAIDRIIAYPTAWTLLEGNIRRALVHRFPYGLLYVTNHDEIKILAVMHLNRKPDYWKDRVK